MGEDRLKWLMGKEPGNLTMRVSLKRLGLQVMEPLKEAEQWSEMIRLKFYIDHSGAQLKDKF